MKCGGCRFQTGFLIESDPEEPQYTRKIQFNNHRLKSARGLAWFHAIIYRQVRQLPEMTGNGYKHFKDFSRYFTSCLMVLRLPRTHNPQIVMREYWIYFVKEIFVMEMALTKMTSTPSCLEELYRLMEKTVANTSRHRRAMCGFGSL